MKNRIKLAVLNLFALAFACPAGFRTANVNDKGVEAPLTPTELLIKGAGVDAKDVTWRIQAGLTPEQAVEVALAEKHERENTGPDGLKKAADAEDKALEEMTVAELQAEASRLGVDLTGITKKADIIDAIEKSKEDK